MWFARAQRVVTLSQLVYVPKSSICAFCFLCLLLDETCEVLKPCFNRDIYPVYIRTRNKARVDFFVYVVNDGCCTPDNFKWKFVTLETCHVLMDGETD